MSWAFKRMGEVMLKIGSGVTPRGGSSVYLNEGRVCLIRSQNIYNSFFSSEGIVYISEEVAIKMKNVSVNKDDVLINITGDSVARCCMPKKDYLPARVNQHVSILRPNSQFLDSSFLMNYLVDPSSQKKFLGLASAGATRNALTKSLLYDFEIPLPPLPTQKKIAGILSAYDDLIENNLKRIKLLEEAAQNIYREWFVHFRYPGHEDVPSEEETGLPEGWESKKLGDIALLNYGKSLKKDTRNGDGVTPVYGSSGIVGFHDTFLVEGEGIILGRKGNVGSVYYSDKSFFPIDTVYYVTSELPLLYMFHFLLNQTWVNSDAAVPGLNRNYAYSKMIVCPSSIELQKWNKHATIIFKQKSVLIESNQKLKEARDILLPRLMNQTIEVD